MSSDESKNLSYCAILREFDRAFEEARRHIAARISEPSEVEAGERGQDWKPKIDPEVAERFYLPIAKANRMMLVTEERSIASPVGFGDSDYVLVLDSVDGSVNMYGGLPFGVNVAFGKTVNPAFRIDDIERVFVGDYFSGKKYVWTKELGLEVVHPTMAGLTFRKHESMASDIFEVPDEASYIPPEDGQAVERQQRLLSAFREAFGGDCQRRAIDCTGLRMMEVYDRNLIAYGDVRRATYTWDTVASIRMLLGTGVLVLDGNLEPISGQTTIVERRGVKIEKHLHIGQEVIVLRQEHIMKLKEVLSKAHASIETVGAATTEICDVFLSYAGSDRKQAEHIKKELHKSGLTCFVADADILPGEDFEERIRGALRSCREMLILVSENSRQSEWVTSEWRIAWALGKTITPVLHRCGVKDLPSTLDSKEAIDLIDLESYVAAFRKRQAAV